MRLISGKRRGAFGSFNVRVDNPLLITHFPKNELGGQCQLPQRRGRLQGKLPHHTFWEVFAKEPFSFPLIALPYIYSSYIIAH